MQGKIFILILSLTARHLSKFKDVLKTDYFPIDCSNTVAAAAAAAAGLEAGGHCV